jgi:hypothetical protein
VALTREEKKQLESISNPTSVKGIELCFETAFIGSPILLFQKFDMTRKTWMRESILQVALDISLVTEMRMLTLALDYSMLREQQAAKNGRSGGRALPIHI